MIFYWILFCFTLAIERATTEIARHPISCNFHDTINISSGSMDHNSGQFSHNGLTYQKGMFAEFDYVIKNNSEVKVDPHIRGCVCKLKNCIRVCEFCSDDDESLNMKCVKRSSQLKVLSSELMEELISLDDDKFVFLEGKICENYYILEPEQYGDPDEWTFLEVIINLKILK